MVLKRFGTKESVPRCEKPKAFYPKRRSILFVFLNQLATMNWVDILLVIVGTLTLLTGWRKGFIVGTMDLVAWVGSIVAGLLFYRHIAELLERYTNGLGVWTLPLSFLITLIGARIILSVITRSLLKIMPEDIHRNSANQFLGIIPGAINAVINATILAALLLALGTSDNIATATRDSRIVDRLAPHVEWLDARLSPIFDEAVKRSMNHLTTVEPTSGKSVNLRFTVANPRIRTDLEAKMLELVNAERRAAGLQLLRADPAMAQVARAHSRDMFARGYFSHVAPDGKTLGDRVRVAKIPFVAAGENLALGPTLQVCHDGLMKSPGHRANILHSSFGRLGIGVLDGGRYGLMITQNFRN